MQIKQIEEWTSLILLIGILISALLVSVGGALYVIQHGNEALPVSLFHYQPIYYTSHEIWRSAFSFSAIGFIQLGLLTLVMTQIARIALLFVFYINIHDVSFILISGFVLLVLIYSLFWRTG